MTVDLIIGTLTPISSNFINPYTGEILSVNGTYYLNDTLITGGPGTNDIALGVTFDQFWRLEDELGNLLIENIEIFLPAPGDDILLLSSDTHVLGDLIIQTAEGNDVVWSNAGNDLIEGGLGDDILHGGPGHDTINGQDDNDDIFGASGNDILSGGTGNDQLSGGTGDDTYVYNTGDGDDTITETSGFDTISLGAGITLGDITFVQNGNDLEIMMADGLTIKDFYSGDTDKVVEQIVFSDTSTYDLTALLVNPPALTPLINSVAAAENLEDPSNVLNGLDEITIVVQVAASHIGTDRGIFDTETSDGRDDGLTLRYDADGWNGGGNNIIKIGLQTTDGQIEYESASNVQTTDNQHLVITWKTGGALKLYIDGVEDIPTNTTGSLGGVIDNVTDLIIGIGAKNVGGWDGSIDNFQIYDTAVNAAEAQALYLNSDMNRTPDAFNDEFISIQDSVIIGNLMDDNGNGADSDPDSDQLQVSAGTYSTENGTITISNTGDFSYTPSAGFSGVDSFTYTLTDVNGASTNATASFVVGTLPNDTFFATFTAEHFDGGYGVDTINYSNSAERINVDLISGIGWDGDASGDTYENIENVVGSNIAGDRDFIYGSDSSNFIWGLAGNDVLEGMGGADIIDGGAGGDFARYSRSDTGVNVNLETGINTGGDAEGDILISIEKLQGSKHNDSLTGNTSDNIIYGDRGDDIIYGGADNDILYGEEGADTFVYGSSDTFGFTDVIKDFSVAEGDKIDISDLLVDYDPLTDAINDFVLFTSSGSTDEHGAISIDVDGGGDNFMLIAYITDQSTLNAETLEILGNLITV